jgi:predicted ATP-dependent protease
MYYQLIETAGRELAAVNELEITNAASHVVNDL